MVKTLKEAEERIRAAMTPPANQAGQNFSPDIQGLRRSAKGRKPPPVRRQLPTAEQ